MPELMDIAMPSQSSSSVQPAMVPSIWTISDPGHAATDRRYRVAVSLRAPAVFRMQTTSAVGRRTLATLPRDLSRLVMRLAGCHAQDYRKNPRVERKNLGASMRPISAGIYYCSRLLGRDCGRGIMASLDDNRCTCLCRRR